MSEDRKQAWLCGNLPGPFETLEELEEFVTENREHADRLLGMDVYIQETEERIWHLKAVRDGRIVPPKPDMSRNDLEDLIAQLETFAASNVAAREDLVLALNYLNGLPPAPSRD